MFALQPVACAILLTTSIVGCYHEQAPNRTPAGLPAEIPEKAGNVDQCSHDRRSATGSPDSIEYVIHEQHEARRILLTEGAARLDFQQRDGKRRRVRTVLVPTNIKEVERLVGTVDAVIASASATPVTAWEPTSEYGNTIIRCRKDGCERMVRIDRCTEEHNFVWEGVRKEIETVALVQLARAVNAWEDGELRIKANDCDGGIEQYCSALKSFMVWAQSRCRRYGGVLFEPTITLSLLGPTGQDQRIEIAGAPDKLMKLPEMTPERAVIFLPRAWQECIHGMVVHHSGTVIVVAFPQAVLPDGWTWGLPVKEIPPHLAERLAAEKEWAVGNAATSSTDDPGERSCDDERE